MLDLYNDLKTPANTLKKKKYVLMAGFSQQATGENSEMYIKLPNTKLLNNASLVSSLETVGRTIHV